MTNLLDTRETVDTAGLPEESSEVVDRIECSGICHNGPIDDSPKALKNAAQHDPDAPAAFLFVFPCCDYQLPICEKKADSLLECELIGSGRIHCEHCKKVSLMKDAVLLPLNGR